MSENNQGLSVQHGVEEYSFRASAADFDKIPGSPLAYWLGTPLQSAFQLGKPIESISNQLASMNSFKAFGDVLNAALNKILH